MIDAVGPAEAKIWANAGTGETIALGQDLPASPDKSNMVRAAFLRALLLDAPDRVDQKGLGLAGAWIVGEFDLSGAKVEQRLEFKNCRFDSPIRLNDAETRSLFFEGVRCPGVSAQRMTVRGMLSMSDDFVADGLVDLQEARIMGSAIFDGGTFNRSQRDEDGEDDPTALRLELATIDGSLLMRYGFCAWGNVRLFHASIGSAVEMLDAAINGEQVQRRSGKNDPLNHWGLNLEGAHIADVLFLAENVSIAEGLRIFKASIGSIEIKTNVAIHAHSPDGVALSAAYSTVAGPLFLERDVLFIDGDASGAVTFFQASVAVLNIDYLTWPKGKSELDGFTYERFAESALYWEADAVEWLLRQIPDHLENFRPQPWEQCAATLQKMGHEKEARRVLIEKERRRLQSERRRLRPWAKIPARLYHSALDHTIRFGYQPSFAGRWLLAFLVIGFVCFWSTAPTTALKNASRPVLVAAEKDPPVFQPFIYALDTFVPVISLGQADAYRPSDAPEAWPLRWFVWIYQLLGWALAGFWVAGFTGLIKK